MEKQIRIGDVVKAKLGATDSILLVVGETCGGEFVVTIQLSEISGRVLDLDDIPITDKYYYNKKRGLFSLKVCGIEEYIGHVAVPKDVQREILRVFSLEQKSVSEFKDFEELSEVISCVEKLQEAILSYVKCAEKVSDALESNVISRDVEELLGDAAEAVRRELIRKTEAVRDAKLKELKQLVEPLIQTLGTSVSDDDILADLREGTSIASVASKYKVAITRVRALNRVVTTEKAKQRLEERNIAIYKKAEAGVSYSELAVEYSLATRTIKQIVKAIRKLMESSEAEESVA